MPIAELDGVDLAYADEGDGGEGTILLLHGFASSKEANWISTGWVRLLAGAGYRVIAPDNRGHGGSTRFHDAAHYSLDLMAGDALGLLDHLGIDRAHVMGYSMGARISARLAIDHGNRIDRLILAGNGYGMIEGTGDWTPVRDALLAPSADATSDARGLAFRKFAEQTGSDLIALAECVSAVRQLFSEEDFAAITNSSLVVIGTRDDIAGSGERLAALMPDARFLPIEGRDHMRTVGDRAYMDGVMAFLQE